MEIPNWTVPKNEREGDSLILDIALFLGKTEIDSDERDEALDVIEARLMSNPKAFTPHQLTSLSFLHRTYLYDKSNNVPGLVILVNHYDNKVRATKQESHDKARSIVIWQNHQLVYWHLPGIFSVLNKLPKSKQEELQNPTIVWQDRAWVLGCGTIFFALYTLIEFLLR